MKCSKCGKVVSLGDIYCSQCGSEIQIVPDFNVFGDDISDVIQQKENTRGNETKEQKEEINKEQEKKVKDNRKKNITILCISLGVISFIAIVLVASIFITSKKNSKSFNYNFSRAEEYYENGMLSEALEFVNYALNADSDNVYAGILKAEILEKQDKYDYAIEVLKDIIAAHPDNLKAYNLIIKYCIEISDYETIAELADKVKDEAIYALFEDYIAEAPKFSLKAGNYDQEKRLTITTNDEAIIYYTIDGTSPKNFGILYTDEIVLGEGVTTVRAYATNEHGVMSEEVEATYIIAVSLPDKPEVSVPSGTYTEVQKITIYVPVGWTAYYTWDDTIPSEESEKYTGPFDMINGNNVLRIVFIKDSEPHKRSEVAQYHYVLNVTETEDNTDGESDNPDDDLTGDE